MTNIKNRIIPVWYDEESLTATEFRRLYSKIRHMNSEQEIKNLMVTSATLGEGKSISASLLAITIARYRNTNTLIIDCDLRRPTIHKKFGLPRENGFIDAVLGKTELKNVLKDSFIPKLKILTSGELVKSPSDIFNHPRLKDIFAEIKYYFDTIIVDCAPAIPVSDPLILSSEMDGALLVVKAGKTPKELVKQTSQQLQDAGVRLFGVIINNEKNVLPYYHNLNYNYYSTKI